MIQEIITYIIIFIAVAYVIWNTVRFFLPKTSKKHPDCNHCCASSCAGCELKRHMKRKPELDFKGQPIKSHINK